MPLTNIDLDDMGKPKEVLGAKLTFDRSPDLGALFAALARAQGEFKPASKDSVNPHFRSKYESLAAVTESLAPLSKNELAYTQLITSDVEGVPAKVSVYTLLGHSSGQWLGSNLELAVAVTFDKNGKSLGPTPQAASSAVTYGRRITLKAITGQASREDDDDGAAASVPQRQNPVEAAKQHLKERLGVELPPEHDEPPPPEQEYSQDAERQGFVWPFGDEKGMDISDVKTQSLKWVTGPKYSGKNEAAKAAARAELQLRGEG